MTCNLPNPAMTVHIKPAHDSLQVGQNFVSQSPTVHDDGKRVYGGKRIRERKKRKEEKEKEEEHNCSREVVRGFRPHNS